MHIPGFDKGTGEHQTISFESVCDPAHYIRQKNYKFVLGKKGDTKFGKLVRPLPYFTARSEQAITTLFECARYRVIT